MVNEIVNKLALLLEASECCQSQGNMRWKMFVMNWKFDTGLDYTTFLA